MLRTLTILALAASTTGCGHPLANSSQVSPAMKNAMSSPTSVSIKSVSLIAREEKSLPPGQPPTPNRDIGFASVFLRIENAKEADAKLVIKSIQIVSNGSVQMASQAPQEILLRPLENSQNEFDLTNKTGYSRPNKVKAVITYQVQDREQVIESSPVEVVRL